MSRIVSFNAMNCVIDFFFRFQNLLVPSDYYNSTQDVVDMNILPDVTSVLSDFSSLLPVIDSEWQTRDISWPSEANWQRVNEISSQLCRTHVSERSKDLPTRVENMSWSTKEKWQTTNEIYADFDSYINPHTKCPSVASFAEIMSQRPQDFNDFYWKSSMQPSEMQERKMALSKRTSIEMIKEDPHFEKQNTAVAYSTELSNKHKKEGFLPLANKQKKAKLVQKSKHNKILAKENITDANDNNITDEATNTQEFQKPNLSLSCLITMALNDSTIGWLLVSEIYSFICDRFPYYKTAPGNWKSSIRHALTKNFVKREFIDGRRQRRCIWSVDSSKRNKLDKWSSKDPLVKQFRF